MLSSSRSGSGRPNIQAGHNLLHRPGLSPVSLHGVFPYPRHRSSSIHSIPVFSNNQGVALLADGPFSRDVTTTPDATPGHSSPTPLIHNRRGRLSINYTGLCSAQKVPPALVCVPAPGSSRAASSSKTLGPPSEACDGLNTGDEPLAVDGPDDVARQLRRPRTCSASPSSLATT